MTGVRIAIVVVTRNCLRELEQTVSSIGALADSRVDLILIDGASTDGTAERVLSLRSCAWHAVSEPDGGIYDAMNKGWQAAVPSSHLLYLGAGDTVSSLPADHELLDPSGEPCLLALGDCAVGDLPFRSRWGLEMRFRNTAHHQALLAHRSLSSGGPFDPRLRVYGDWDFNLQLLNRGLTARSITGLRTRAEPGGVSWHHDLREIREVATRHSGAAVGTAAYLLNAVSRWRRERAMHHGR